METSHNTMEISCNTTETSHNNKISTTETSRKTMETSRNRMETSHNTMEISCNTTETSHNTTKVAQQFNWIQYYLYSAFYDTIVAKQLYRKSSFHYIFIYCRNVIYLTCGKNLYTVWGLASSEVLRGVGIISSQVFGHLGLFKVWIQTEACVVPSYHGMLIMWQKQRNK